MRVRQVGYVLGMLASGVGAAEAPDRYFDTRGVAAFANPRPGLTTYLGRGAGRGEQHICVLGVAFRNSDGMIDRHAWVHWREGRRLILWDGSKPAYPASRIGWGRDDLHLDRDVVAREEDIRSSTYLVTRAWANRIIADCAVHGRQLRLRLRLRDRPARVR